MPRKIRTAAERMAAAKAEAARIEANEIANAIDLHEKAVAWDARAVELTAKAKGARAAADEKLRAVGQDPEKFWAEYQPDEEE